MKRTTIILLFSWIALLSACTEKVEVQLGDNEPKVVIEGFISTETDSSFIRISKTISYFNSGKAPGLTNALVEVNDGNQTFDFTHVGEGLYKASPGFRGETDKTYFLEVQVDGETFRSSEKLHPMFTLDPDIRFDYRPASGFVEEGYAVTYWSKENRNELIFTQFNCFENDTLLDIEIIFSNDGLVKGQDRPFELPFYRAQSGDSVVLVFRSLGPQPADYLNALATLNSGAPGPFQTPPANPPSNISGGAIGVFICSEIVRIGKKAP